ncbi:hypothetical protein KSP40_PGU011362 [Platanthera guangdongensis]|uniref:Uncharacterized protein n=1 Tax=Platanthera guangdongensis TaxID=2320717 RepID=A0ABR2LXB4_9ASPA
MSLVQNVYLPFWASGFLELLLAYGTHSAIQFMEGVYVFSGNQFGQLGTGLDQAEVCLLVLHSSLLSKIMQYIH